MPWPLDEDYFRQTNEAINLYLLCNSEYTNFLKWSLFYGMYYLDRQVEISYIKNTTNDIDEELYSIFKLLNTIEKPYSTDDINESFKEERKKKNNINLIKKSNFDKNDGRKMSFCKRRFYYEGLIDGLGTYSTEFLCKRYIKVLMLLKVTEEINYRRCWNNVDHIEIIINKRLENLKKLIPAWSREVSDVKAFIIKNLKVYREKVENGIYNIDKPYFEIKKNFIDMKFTEIIDGVEERVCVDKCESVYNYNIQVSKIIEFINEGGGSEYSGIMLEKCRVCKYGDICSRYYRERG